MAEKKEKRPTFLYGESPVLRECSGSSRRLDVTTDFTETLPGNGV
jgi:hypothetical protein